MASTNGITAHVQRWLAPFSSGGRWSWTETVALTLLACAIGFAADPQQPFFVAGEFPWLWFAPTLLALRYGTMSGVVSGAILLLAWLLFHTLALTPAAEFPKTYFFGGLILTMICGEFSDIWQTRLRRLNEANHYLDERLGRITKLHHLLRLSHDRLEQELLSRPATLRDTLSALRELVIKNPDNETLPAAAELIVLLAQYCQIESAALYRCDPEGGNLELAASVGTPSPPDATDPLLRHALETRALAHIRSTGINPSHTTGSLVVAPVQNSDGVLFGMLVVDGMPFFALNQDTLQLMSVMLGYYADSTSHGTALRDILQCYPDCPTDFAEEAAKLWGLAHLFGLDSNIVTLTFLPNGECDDALALVKRMKRSLDIVWVAACGDRILHINLMPLSGDMAVEGYLSRIDALLKQHFGYTLEDSQINFHVTPLAQESVLAVLDSARGNV